MSTQSPIEQENVLEALWLHRRVVRKVFGHFEYLENRSLGLDVTWQPVRGDLTVHP